MKMRISSLNKYLFLFIAIMINANTDAQFKKLKSLVNKNKDKNVEIDFSANKFPPTIEFQSILGNMELDPQTGLFVPGTLRAYFLPSKDKKGNTLNYSPSSSNPKDMLIRADLFRLDKNDKLMSFFYEAGNIQRVSTQIVVSTRGSASKGFNTEITLKAAAKYEMRFYLAGSHFYTWPFEVRVTVSDDPYSPVSEIYTIGGAWEDYAILQINHNNKGGDYSIRFQPIIDYRGIHVQSNSSVLSNIHEAEIKCTLKRDGQIIGSVYAEEGKSNDIFSSGVVPVFDEYDLYTDKLYGLNGSMNFLKIPKPTAGTEHFVQMKDLKDGSYTIEMHIRKMDDRGELKKTYAFELVNGSFIGADIGNRKVQKDMVSFIETGRDYVLIQAK